MNSLERVINTFNGCSTDKVPIYHVTMSSEIGSALLGREAYIGGGIQQFREARALWQGQEAHMEFIRRSYEDAFEICRLLNMDIVRPSYWRLPVKPSKKIDEFTYMYGNKKNWSIRRFIPETELFEVVESSPVQKEVTFLDIEAELDKKDAELCELELTENSFPAIKEALGVFGGEKAIRASGAELSIPLETIWFEAMYLRPDLIERNLRIQVEYAKKYIECMSEMGIMFIFGGGDFASNDGPMYSPAIFQKFMLPALKEIVACCHEKGMRYLYCSDGNLWPVADYLFGESGVDGYYEVDRRAGMDLEKLRLKFPDLTLLGNISSYTLHMKSKSEVIEETMSCLETAKRLGRIIVGCSNSFVQGTPLENIYAMLETLDKYRDITA